MPEARSFRRGSIRTVFFDAAGTLLQVAEPVGETYARIAGRHGVGVTPTAIGTAFRAAFAAAAPLAFPGARPAELRSLERAWWRRVVGNAFGACGVAPGPALDAAFAEIFAHFAAPRAWRVYHDVVPALEQLRRREVALAVVSNFDARLVALLEGSGLASYFSAVIASSEHGAAKPAPAIFHAALRACHAEPHSTLHVGDSLELDLRAARAAGLSAVRIDRDAAPDADTLDGLLGLLVRLGPAPVSDR